MTRMKPKILRADFETRAAATLREELRDLWDSIMDVFNAASFVIAQLLRGWPR